jgi:hypothetical protein
MLRGLQDALDGKSDVGHMHTAREIADFETAVDSRIIGSQVNFADAKVPIGII